MGEACETLASDRICGTELESRWIYFGRWAGGTGEWGGARRTGEGAVVRWDYRLAIITDFSYVFAFFIILEIVFFFCASSQRGEGVWSWHVCVFFGHRSTGGGQEEGG